MQTLRKLKGLSQKDMAEKLNKSPSAYSRMENGEVKIVLDELPEIAKILDCSVEDLLKDISTINILQHNENVNQYNESVQQFNEKAISGVETLNDISKEMIEQFQIMIESVLAHQTKMQEQMHQIITQILHSK